MSSWLSHPENLKAMRRLGTLGEGGFLMRNNLYGLNIERTVRYDINAETFKVPGWQSSIGGEPHGRQKTTSLPPRCPLATYATYPRRRRSVSS